MGNEASQQQFVRREDDVSVPGAVIGQNLDCATEAVQIGQNCAMQHLKLADWEKAGIRLLEPTQLYRNQSGQTHFSDYSLYPDRFADQEPAPGGLPIRRRNSLSSDPSSTASTSPTIQHPYTNVPVPISKYSFKIRSPSEIESLQESSELMAAAANKQRTMSYGSCKLYYFDFSMIPDKDPNFTVDERRPVPSRRRLYSTGDVDVRKLENDAAAAAASSSSTTTAPVTIPSPPVIKVMDHDTIKEEEERPKPRDIPPRRRKTSAPPRFCFFDYSMIPDKDPRWTQKPNRDVELKQK